MIKRYFDYSPVRFIYLLLGGVGISIIIILQSYLVTDSSTSNFSGGLNHTILTFWKYSLWPIFIPGIQIILNRIYKSSTSKSGVYLFGFVVFLILVLAHSVLSNVFYYMSIFSLGSTLTTTDIFREYLIFFWPIYLSRLADLFLILMGLFLFNSYQNYTSTKIQLVELERNLKESELSVLRNQIQPHFLFNTLNTISALIDQDSSKAQKVLSKTAGFLRILLTQSDKTIVSLDEELRMITDYLAIEAERFNDRLDVDIEVNEKSRRYQIPHFILQPIVENSIKHGVSKSSTPITIKIKSKVLNGRLSIEVSDNGPGALNDNEDYSKGIGLRNVKKRLYHIYQDEAELKVETTRGIGFNVSITLPNSLES